MNIKEAKESGKATKEVEDYIKEREIKSKIQTIMLIQTFIISMLLLTILKVGGLI